MTNEELVEQLQAGDADSAEQILQNNQEYIYKLARRFSRDDVTIIDLVQEGNIAILDAAVSFQLEWGVQFLTYATPIIRKAMRGFMAMMSLPMVIPASRYSQLRRVNFLIAKFQMESASRSPQKMLQMICREMGVSERVARGLLRDFGTIYHQASEDNWWEQNIPCFDVDPAKVYERQLLAECIEGALDEVSPRERTLIQQHLGLGAQNDAGITFQELAVLLNFNGHSAAEKAYKKAVEALRQALYAGRYGEYVRARQAIASVMQML